MEPSTGPPVALLSSRSRLLRGGLWLLFGLVAVAGIALWAVETGRPSKPEESGKLGESRDAHQEELPSSDPRLAYTGPFRNVHPRVRYVGDRACVGCHRTETEGFHRHPMGRSIVPVSQLAQRFDTGVRNPFEALQSRFTVEHQGGRVWHKQQRLGAHGEVLATFHTEAEYAIGSGARGHSYFTTRGGFLFQTPISWYSQKQIWDLSPGFPSGHLRPVGAECLFCHANSVRPVEHSFNRYELPVLPEPAIGCERCHGPGEVHVKARRNEEHVRGRIDFTIVNPKHLAPELRENVCQQCHLEGVARVLRRGRGLFDYRPGLPLRDFCAVYVVAPELHDEQRAVSQPEQMDESKCFRASKGKLGCATCHNPHDPQPPEQRAAYYRNKCLTCHETEHPCSLDLTVRLRKSKGDSCIDCHMTRLLSSDIAHTATTDHRIPRKPLASLAEPPSSTRPVLPENPLLPFHGKAKEDADADRDLGIALAFAARAKGGKFEFYLPRAVELLTKAAAKRPHDLDLLVSLGGALEMQRQQEEALDVYRRILAQEPNHELAARGVASLSLALKRFPDALKYLEKALTLNPWDTQGHVVHALLLARERRYDEAVAACRKALKQEPIQAEAWLVLAYCHRKMGQGEQAARDEQQVEALKTPELEQFRASFASMLE